MKLHKIVLGALLPLTSMLAADTASHDNLIGTWQQEDGGKGPSVWLLETKGDSFHITHSQGDQKLFEVTCEPRGAECNATDGTKKAKIVMYYNGPTLVQIETLGSNVTKRSFTAEAETMDLEVTAISNGSKPETLHLKRMPAKTP